MSDNNSVTVCARCGHTIEEAECERVGLVWFCPGCAQDYKDDIKARN